MRIGVLTGGGDVPGLNPCIQAIVLAAAERGWEVVGFRRGWQGVLAIDPEHPQDGFEHHAMPLTHASVHGIDREGGTILHTSRIDPRTLPGGDGTDHILCVLKALGIDAMLTLGGDGTLRFSAHLASLGYPVISIPKTMDNDIYGTDYCIGFSTAISRSVDAINALRTTAASHERIAVVELFGRKSGETALLAGLLSRADRTVIAEVPADTGRLVDLLREDRARSAKGYAVLVVSEGARMRGEAEPDMRQPATSRAIGIGHRIAHEIEARAQVGTLVQELAYLMRAGAPDAFDRLVGFAFGRFAIELLEDGNFGRMLAVRDGNYTHIPCDTLLQKSRAVDVAALYDADVYRPRLARINNMPMFLY